MAKKPWVARALAIAFILVLLGSGLLVLLGALTPGPSKPPVRIRHGAGPDPQAVHVDPADAQQKVPFFVDALRTAYQNGASEIRDPGEVDATWGYLDGVQGESRRTLVIEYQGEYFGISSA